MKNTNAKDVYEVTYIEEDKDIYISQKNAFGIGFTIDYDSYKNYFKGIKLFFERSCSMITIENYSGKVTDLISGSPRQIKFSNSELLLGDFAAQHLELDDSVVVLDMRDAKFDYQSLVISTKALASSFGMMIDKPKNNITKSRQWVTYQ